MRFWRVTLALTVLAFAAAACDDSPPDFHTTSLSKVKAATESVVEVLATPPFTTDELLHSCAKLRTLSGNALAHPLLEPRVAQASAQVQAAYDAADACVETLHERQLLDAVDGISLNLELARQALADI
jgi:hypothetical protein